MQPKKTVKIPYSDRADSDKVFTNWTKTLSLYERDEFSMAVVRAAVSLELAANLVIRSELVTKRNLDKHFVDNLLLWANGLNNKFTRIILPLLKDDPDLVLFKTIKKLADKVNSERNSVAHSGTFVTKKIALSLIEDAQQAITDMVCRYNDRFEIGLSHKDQKRLQSRR